MTFEKKP